MTLADKFADSKTVFANVLELLFCARCLQNMEATMFKSLQFFIFLRFFNSAEVALGGGRERGLGRGRSNCYIDGKCEGGGRCSGFKTFEDVKFPILIFDLINTQCSACRFYN